MNPAIPGSRSESTHRRTFELLRPEQPDPFEARADETEKRITPKEDTERSFDAEESVGEAIELFGEEVGWDGLSEWAREHLEDDGEKA